MLYRIESPLFSDSGFSRESPFKQFQASQALRSSDTAVYIPTNCAVLVRQGAKPLVIQINVDDLNRPHLCELSSRVNRLETHGVIYCGVLTASSDSHKLFAHAASPRMLFLLVNSANSLCDGPVVANAEVTIGFNPQKQHTDGPLTYQGLVPNGIVRELKSSNEWMRLEVTK